jgi:hypothetical protein
LMVSMSILDEVEAEGEAEVDVDVEESPSVASGVAVVIDTESDDEDDVASPLALVLGAKAEPETEAEAGAPDALRAPKKPLRNFLPNACASTPSAGTGTRLWTGRLSPEGLIVEGEGNGEGEGIDDELGLEPEVKLDLEVVDVAVVATPGGIEGVGVVGSIEVIYVMEKAVGAGASTDSDSAGARARARARARTDPDAVPSNGPLDGLPTVDRPPEGEGLPDEVGDAEPEVVTLEAQRNESRTRSAPILSLNLAAMKSAAIGGGGGTFPTFPTSPTSSTSPTPPTSSNAAFFGSGDGPAAATAAASGVVGGDGSAVAMVVSVVVAVGVIEGSGRLVTPIASKVRYVVGSTADDAMASAFTSVGVETPSRSAGTF